MGTVWYVILHYADGFDELQSEHGEALDFESLKEAEGWLEGCLGPEVQALIAVQSGHGAISEAWVVARQMTRYYTAPVGAQEDGDG